jgi:hypothetical protein
MMASPGAQRTARFKRHVRGGSLAGSLSQRLRYSRYLRKSKEHLPRERAGEMRVSVLGRGREGDEGRVVIRRIPGQVVVAAALVVLFVLALVLARAQGELALLPLDLTEHLFGIVLAVFVFERMLAWREERRWLAAKNWLYMLLLETIDDLLKRLLPVTVPREVTGTAEKIAVYEVTGKRVHFGGAVVYSPLKLLASPDDKDLQRYISWYAGELGPPRYADLAKEALADAREQIRNTFGYSARLMEADITAMLMSFEQAALAAIRHLESATIMRNEKLEHESYREGEQSAERSMTEADHELAFASSIIVESVVGSATKPKAWLEDQIRSLEGRSHFRHLQSGS